MKNELLKILKDCLPRVLFTTDEKRDDLNGIQVGPYPELVVCEHGDISFSGLTAEGRSEFKIVDRNRQNTAAILYTGGTTGPPKGALCSEAGHDHSPADSSCASSIRKPVI